MVKEGTWEGHLQAEVYFLSDQYKNKHWTVAVIFMEDKRIQYYDSFGNTDMVKLNGLLQYVKDEYRAKNGKEMMAEMDALEWKLVPCHKDTPQQKNGELYLSVLG